MSELRITNYVNLFVNYLTVSISTKFSRLEMPLGHDPHIKMSKQTSTT